MQHFFKTLVLFFIISLNVYANSYPAPDGYRTVNEKNGWQLYVNTINVDGYPLDGNTYVQRINVNKVNILPYTGQKTIINKQEYFNRASLTHIWKDFERFSPYSVTSGVFFEDQLNYNTRLSLPFKQNGNIKTMGYSTFHDDYEKSMLIINDDSAITYDYDESILKHPSFKNVIVGLNPSKVSKRQHLPLGRMFVGTDIQGDSYIYIVTSEAATQNHMENTLLDFNVYPPYVMFDGSGTAQLAYKNKNGLTKYVYGRHGLNQDKRPLPQGFLIFPK